MSKPKKITKDFIADIVIHLLMNINIYELSAEAIANACGIRKPSLFHHFKSMQDIFSFACEKKLKNDIEVGGLLSFLFWMKMRDMLIVTTKFKYLLEIIERYRFDIHGTESLSLSEELWQKRKMLWQEHANDNKEGVSI